MANDTEADLLYHNNGNGTFTEIGLRSGFALDPRGRSRAGMGIDAGVVDHTGEETIFVGNFSREMTSVFRYRGGREFEERATLSGIGKASLPSVTFGLSLFDATLDGALDVLAVNGHVRMGMDDGDGYITFRQRAQLFLNDGAGFFTEVPAGDSVFGQRLLGRGLAVGDFDRDGDLDVLITENGSRAHLWRNETRRGEEQLPYFLRLRLEGRSSNRSAIGTQVIATSKDRRMYRYVRSGGSYLSQSQPDVFFGLDGLPLIDTLHITWPNGLEEVFEDVQANQELLLIEGSGQMDINRAYHFVE